MSPKIRYFIAVLLLASLALTSCNGGQGTESPAPDMPEGPIKMGATLPLSGAYADTGQWVERGYQYWATEINESNGLLGQQVELIIYDDESDSQKAIELLEKLLTEDEVDLILGGYPGTAAAQQMAVAERHEMVYVSMGGHLPSFEQGFTYSFGGPPLMGQWWYEGFWQWLDTLPQADRPQKLAMITLNNVVGLSVRENTVDGASRYGIETVMDELYDLPLEAADDLIAQAQEAGADLFVANGFLPDGVVTVQSMKALGYSPNYFLQGIGSLVPTWTEQLGDDGLYVFSGTAIHPDLPFPGVAELNAATSELYGTSEAPSYFMFGYAWAQTLQAGIEGAGSLDQSAIRDYLRANPISTVGGTFEFDERGLPEPYSYLTQLLPTGGELIWPEEVRTADPVFPKPAWEK